MVNRERHSHDLSPDDCIRRAADFLVEDRHCIMPRLDEKPRQLAGQVFIEFESHGESLCTQGHYSLLGQFGGVVQSSPDRIGGNGRIALGDVLDGQSGGEIVQDDRYHHTSASNAGLAVTDIRIDGYVLMPVHSQLISATRVHVPLSPYPPSTATSAPVRRG